MTSPTEQYEGPAASPAQVHYFMGLKREVERCYRVAEEARSRGLDPRASVEIPMAEDLAARVERLVGPPEVAPMIREFSQKHGNREEVSLKVAEQIARDPGFANRGEALDQAVRTGLAILTEGVLVAPLEGIAEAKIASSGGGEYVDLYFAGPIRSAGGTGQALSVLIADVVRRALGIGAYSATNREVERYKEEIPRYKQIQHLQYTPTAEEIEIMARGCPVCINGEGTEDEEVSGHRNLERVSTNRIRGGACLVMAEGMCLKASKLQKHVKNLKIEGWEFIDEFIDRSKGKGGKGEGEGDDAAGNGGGADGAAVVGPAGSDRGVPGALQPGGLEDGLDPEELESLEELKELEGMDDLESFGPAASEKYIKEIIAGRPVFAHPSRAGGFRLRYGRARTAGLASLAIHPASMFLVNEFLAIGTQMKIERPGKATVSTPCDILDPPTVIMEDGTFREMTDPEEIREKKGRIAQIVDLGEILVPYGEFMENNHDLVPAAFSPEWWALEAADILGGGEMGGPGTGGGPDGGVAVQGTRGPDGGVAVRGEDGGLGGPRDMCGSDEPAVSIGASHVWGLPLHPRWNLFWHDISQVAYHKLFDAVRSGGRFEYDPNAPPSLRYGLTIPFDGFVKDALVDLGAFHELDPGGNIRVGRYSLPLASCLGLRPRVECGGPADLPSGPDDMDRWVESWRPRERAGLEALPPPGPPAQRDAAGVDAPRDTKESDEAGAAEDRGGTGGTAFPRHDSFRGALGLIRTRTGLTVYPRAPVRIGTRMGRPEKAKERKMNPLVHVLFPLGRKAGGPQRLVKKAAEEPRISVEMGMRICPQCGERGFQYRCGNPECRTHTQAPETPHLSEQKVSVGELLDGARRGLDIPPGGIPDMKGVQGLISAEKTPEPLAKGILRARHGVSIFKDGTVRYDMTDVPLTHFRPREIGTPPARLVELGYTHDIGGAPLERDDQILELKVQDLVASKGFGKYMTGTAKFVDDLLVRFYGLEPYYNVEGPEDLIGHLVIGLAPHTSGGVLGRLIGYTSAAVGFAHPYYHAAKRRNCDGDEDCLMLVMDGLLNFSRTYLPSSRGGQMDAPLVLSTRLDPNEIDKEAHNLDVGTSYPLELYRAAQAAASPKEVEALMDTVSKRIGTPAQYEGLGFTHDTGDINLGPPISAYKSLGTMVEKMKAQLALARRLRAVDESDVADKVITSHFLPDMQGNLRSFTQQGARCTKCNAKYRRVPLRGEGKCIKRGNDGTTCGGNLVLTVHEGGVIKYLEISKEIIREFDIPHYTRQRIGLLEESIRSTFQNDKVRTTKLSDFL